LHTDPWNEDEPLLDGLDHVPAEAFDAPVPAGQFHEAVLRRTVTVLHRRTGRRRLLVIGGLLTAYAAGLATAYLAIAPAQPLAAEQMTDRVAPDVPEQAQAAAPSLAELPPWTLEEQAESAPPERRPELFKLAGDRYLNDYSDPQKALRCYRQHLDLVPVQQRSQFDPDDTWLLVTLKQAREWESTHEKTDT